MRLPRSALPMFALAALAAAPLAAQERVVIYRCTSADGAVIVQNDRPCPAGTTQQDRRVIQAPRETAPSATRAGPSATGPASSPRPAGESVAPPPTGTPQADAPARAPAATSPTTLAPPPTSGAPTALATVPGVAPTEDAAPPPLYECRVIDGSAYLGENPNPAPRCAPLATAGIGAAPAAGAACEVVRDECTPVPAATLCDRWRERLRTLESALTFGRLDERDTAAVEIDRVREIVDDSACGG